MDLNKNILLGTEYASDDQLRDQIDNQYNVLAGWVTDYDMVTNTVNVSPAMFEKVLNEGGLKSYAEKPFIIKCPVIANTLGRYPVVGDLAILVVMDDESRTFFKQLYDPTRSFTEQTYVPTNNYKKSIVNCVAILYTKKVEQTTIPCGFNGPAEIVCEVAVDGQFSETGTDDNPYSNLQIIEC